MRFDYGYDEEQRADYRLVELGTELTMTGDDLPEAWLAARHLHIGPLAASSRRQLEFLDRARERGFEGTVSVGSFLDELDESLQQGDVETAVQLDGLPLSEALHNHAVPGGTLAFVRFAGVLLGHQGAGPEEGGEHGNGGRECGDAGVAHGQRRCRLKMSDGIGNGWHRG